MSSTPDTEPEQAPASSEQTPSTPTAQQQVPLQSALATNKPRKSSVKRVVTVLPVKEELVAVTPNQRNWRGILIALLVIVAVLGLIVFSIILLSPPDEGPRVKGRKFSLDDIVSGRFQAPAFNGTWVSDVELVYRDVYGGVSIFNAENLTSKVLMTNSTFRQLNAVDYRISSDLKFILLIKDIKKVFRHSFEARYFIYDIETQNKAPLSPVAEASSAPPLQLVQWAPRGNALAFVHDNDLYYRPSARNDSAVRISYSGLPGVLCNGVPDWLYEEEILQSNSAVWFSADGEMLLYGSFNDSLVGELRYPWYGSLQQRLKYPALKSLRYPKAGTRNPIATLWAVELSQLEHKHSPDTHYLTPPLAIKASPTEWDHYFTAVSWLVNHQVSVIWMNRRQNMSIISVCTAPVWTCEETHIERAHEGWVDVYDAPVFSSESSSYLALLPVQDAENGFFKHVVHVHIESRRVSPLTHGAFEVTQLLAWDEESHLVYFVAAPEGKPGQRHLYRVQDLLNVTTRIWECLTCPAPKNTLAHWSFYGSNINSSNSSDVMKGRYCLYAQPHFSLGPSPRYYVLECLGPETPFSVLVETSTNTKIAILDAQSGLKERIDAMAFPQVKTFEVEVNKGYHAQVRLHLPPGHRDFEEMTFPLVLHVDGAPGSQLVSHKWNVDWSTYLASKRNFIVAQIDGRGSGFQGSNMRHELFHHLGSVEVEDQIAVIKYLRDLLKYIDKEHIGVWGWSYGGFAAAMILAQDQDVFQCGISVAPVTNWAHYDSAYSERYMGTPNVTDNYKGYEESDVTKRAGNLNKKMFLLIHGTADNTVHYQQSMMLVKALTTEGVLFRHLTYPDEGHTFSGVQDHFYKAMESFFDDCFGPLDFEDWEVGSSFFTFKQ